MLGSNGGGFFGANAAALFHNPTGLSNLFESVAIVLLPVALVVMFGQMVGRRQAMVIYAVMLGLLVLAVIGTTLSELHLGQHVAGVAGSTALEGKNVVNGIGLSALWNTLSTAVSNGSVNASLDSFTPLGGLILMLLMQLGEIVYGGVGSGLYGMLSFVLLTVFISGLMVGRTPEYLGKKIASYDMKMVALAILLPLVLTLVSTGIAVSWPGIRSSLTNTGAHGFSEILYGFSSMGNNNGSLFAGFNGDQLMGQCGWRGVNGLHPFCPATGDGVSRGQFGQEKANGNFKWHFADRCWTLCRVIVSDYFIDWGIEFCASPYFGANCRFSHGKVRRI